MNGRLFMLAWILVFITFIDMNFTQYNLDHGRSEINPMASWFYTHNMLAVYTVLWCTLIMLATFYIDYKDYTGWEYVYLVVIVFKFSLGVVSNYVAWRVGVI